MDFAQLINTQEIFNYVAAHKIGTVVTAVITLYISGIILVSLYQRYGFYVWYFVVFSFALIGIFTPIRLYCYAFMLGMATAFAEIISKFKDEPIKALKMPHALLYHVLNGAISAFALKMLVVFSGPERIAKIRRSLS